MYKFQTIFKQILAIFTFHQNLINFNNLQLKKSNNYNNYKIKQQMRKQHKGPQIIK